MIVRELVTLMGFEVDKASEKRARRGFDGMKRAAVTLATVFTGRLAGAVTGAIKMAGDANETMSQLEATFGDAAEGVKDFADSTAGPVQRSRFELAKYAAQIGALIKPQLGSAEAAAEMSKGVAGLAVDLGSFFNATDEDALMALRAGLIGSSEPLLRFGVDLRRSNIALDQQSLGLKGAFKDLTSAQQIQVRYAAILRQTTDAQGDAARTSQSFSNVLRGTQARIRDLSIEFGMVLIPAATSFLTVVGELVDMMKGPLLLTARLVATALGAFARAGRFLADVISDLTLDLKIMGAVALVAFAIMAAPVLVTIGLLGLLAAAVLLVIEDLEVMGEGGESVTGGLVGEFQHLLGETDSIFGAIGGILKTAIDFWSKLFGLDDAREQFSQFFDDFTVRAEAFARVLAGLANPLIAIARATDENAEAFTALGDQLVGEGLTAITGAFRAATGGGGGATTNNAAASVEVTVNAPGNASAGDLAQSVGTAAQKGTERGLRQTLNQLGVGAGG